ncbi:putative hexosyltransferase [Rosa chinensis]|uniref:Putative hexosyltransferase n=1 Tax=Rosa chinensis TaxID=74649 RepID=A0A2P6SD24_ROSCH|nr:putative hexosyltransferase [Rosa chinensis]
MFNTCDYLERPFIDYMTEQMGIPTWGVGPLLPESYWQSPSDSSIRHRQIRAKQRQSNYTEDDVVKWLDGKPPGSVLYVAFGSEVGPTPEEYPELAGALEESTGPFIWVIQPGSGGSEPGYGLESKVGERVLIRGWAPQLLILSHPSTGGFLSHCGWNSTAEALGRGVPFLGWPVRGDQYFNAKLVVNHLKEGGCCERIEKLMGDEEMKKRALAIRQKFENGFPASSEAALDAFGDFITSEKQLRSYIHTQII